MKLSLGDGPVHIPQNVLTRTPIISGVPSPKPEIQDARERLIDRMHFVTE
jgi:hypothetical protein